MGKGAALFHCLTSGCINVIAFSSCSVRTSYLPQTSWKNSLRKGGESQREKTSRISVKFTTKKSNLDHRLERDKRSREILLVALGLVGGRGRALSFQVRGGTDRDEERNISCKNERAGFYTNDPRGLILERSSLAGRGGAEESFTSLDTR